MRNGGIQIRISDLIFALKKRWKLILAITALALFFGLALSGMSYVQSNMNSYEVTGSFAVNTLNSNGQYINGSSASNNNDYHLAEDMVDAVRYVIRSKRVMDAVINDRKLLGVTTDDISEAITVSQYNSTQILEMALVWRNPEEAVELWNAVVTAVNRILPQTLQLGSLSVINEPMAELYGSSSTGPKATLLLALLGLAAGIGFAILEMVMHPTLNNVKDVEPLLGLENLGLIPRDPNAQTTSGNIVQLAESSPSMQSYAATTYILRNRLGSKEKNHCFFVTSTNAHEGKSIVAANLALQLSNMECRTLLIDFDTRNPSLGAMFLPEVDYARSLNAFYRGEANEQDAIIHINGCLDLLPTVLEHNPIPLDGTVEEMIRGFMPKYDYIIIDSAPVGIVSDTLSLNQITNTALFVVGYDTATIPDIQASVEKMDKAGIRIVGAVVNGMTGKGQEKNSYAAAGAKPKKKTRPQQTEETFVKVEPDAAVTDLTQAADAADKKQQKPALTPEAVQNAVKSSRPRNVMDDLVKPDASKPAQSDRDIMSALYKLGIEGEWENAADQAADLSAAPVSQDKPAEGEEPASSKEQSSKPDDPSSKKK